MEETVDKIILLIKKNPNITVKELSLKVGLSVRGVEWNISKLKEKGKLKRIGSTKKGQWKIIE